MLPLRDTTRSKVRAALLTIAGATLLWAIWITLAGGFVTTIAGLRIRSNNPQRVLMITAIALGGYFLPGGRFQSRGWPRPRGARRPRLRAPGDDRGAARGLVDGGRDHRQHEDRRRRGRVWLRQPGRPLAAGPSRSAAAVGRGVPWPDAKWTFTPLGYRPADHPNGDDEWSIVPTYSPGLPILLAVAKGIGGQCVMFGVVRSLPGWRCWPPTASGPAALALRRPDRGVARRDQPDHTRLVARTVDRRAGRRRCGPSSSSSSSGRPRLRRGRRPVGWRCHPDPTEPRAARGAAGRLVAVPMRHGRPIRPHPARSRRRLRRRDRARRGRGRGDQPAPLWVGDHLGLWTARGSSGADARAPEPPALYLLVLETHTVPAARPGRAARAATEILAAGGRPQGLRRSRHRLVVLWGLYCAYLEFESWGYLRFLLPSWPLIMLGSARSRLGGNVPPCEPVGHRTRVVALGVSNTLAHPSGRLRTASGRAARGAARPARNDPHAAEQRPARVRTLGQHALLRRTRHAALRHPRPRVAGPRRGVADGAGGPGLRGARSSSGRRGQGAILDPAAPRLRSTGRSWSTSRRARRCSICHNRASLRCRPP